MNELNFKNSIYKEKALNSNSIQISNKTYLDAFFLLINGVSIEDLSNLCSMMQEYYSSLPKPINLSKEDCYNLTQNGMTNDIEKQIIFNLAEKCIKSGSHLGNKVINDGKINTSSWISHSFYVSEMCSALANKLNIDVNTAKIVGLLHDFGRKNNHSFSHSIDGYETLINFGWDNEAIGCLTHSFVNGGRCSNNEPALDGFYVDKNGNAKWKEGVNKDDITLFLENYEYSDYDILLNIADLMATDKGIVSPKERLDDIATRRTIDPTNRGYFLCDLTNTLIGLLKRIDLINPNVNFIKDDESNTLEQIQNYFYQVAEYFYNVYLTFQKEQEKNKSI